MRSFRLLVLATVTAGLTSSVAAAQRSTGWQDSWYWGAYGGYTSFATTIPPRKYAPTIGADWVITRTRVALNVFAEQSYFNAVSTVPDASTPAAHKVDIQDLRRVGFAGMFFLPEIPIVKSTFVKPYFGAGYSFNFIKSATPEGSCGTSVSACDSIQRTINNQRSMGKAFANVGFMVMYRRFAPFAQYMIMPTQGRSDWMVNGTGFTSAWALGLRYNFGTSIEKNF